MKNIHELDIFEKKINVFLLCGGIGSRISKYTKKTPKPLIRVERHPFLYYLIKNLTRYNFKNFYLLTYYKHEKFLEFKKKYQKILKVKIKIISEKQKLDTGGAVLNAIKKINNKFDYMVLNGDTYLDANFDNIYAEFLKLDTIYMPIIKTKKESFKLNAISTEKSGRLKFSKKSRFMNSGTYLFKKKHLKSFFNYKKCSLENDILIKKIKQKKVYGFKCYDNFIDIGSYSSLNKINNFIKKFFYPKKTLFLDRDNTLNYDDGYVHKVKNLKLIKKNILEIKKKYRNYLKVIITNQSGIGRKIFSKKNFDVFTYHLIKKLYNENIFISKVYYCPHHIDAKEKRYKRKCNFRKPNTGMINMALKKLEIIKDKNCLIIGNDKNDQELSKRTNIKYVDANKII